MDNATNNVSNAVVVEYHTGLRTWREFATQADQEKWLQEIKVSEPDIRILAQNVDSVEAVRICSEIPFSSYDQAIKQISTDNTSGQFSFSEYRRRLEEFHLLMQKPIR